MGGPNFSKKLVRGTKTGSCRQIFTHKTKILSGPIFSREDQIFQKKMVRGTIIFNEKIGPGTKIFRTKIPVTLPSDTKLVNLTSKFASPDGWPIPALKETDLLKQGAYT